MTVTRVSEADSLTDIFIPQLIKTDTQTQSIFISAIIILVAISVFFYLYRRYTNPLRKLERQLVKQTITPRDAAHRLAQIMHQKPINDTDQQILTKLDRMRFQKQAPSPEALQVLIRESLQ